VFFDCVVFLCTGYRFGMDSGLACSDFRIMRWYAYPNTDSYSNTYPNSYTDTYPNSYTDTDTDTDSYANTDTRSR
jgi:hypothetical protein